MTKNDQIAKSLMDCFANLPEVDEALDAIATALEAQADATKAEEPYATRTIDDLHNAARRVRDLKNVISDFNAK